MADLLASVTNTKHQLDGEEEVIENYIIPREKIRSYEKAIVIKNKIISPPSSEPVLYGVIAPFNRFEENLNDGLFITDLVYSTLSSGQCEILDTGYIISDIISYNYKKAFKHVYIKTDNLNTTNYIDTGDNVWREVGSDGLEITDSILFGDNLDSDLDMDLTGLGYPNKLRYKVSNDTGVTETINYVNINFEYYE